MCESERSCDPCVRIYILWYFYGSWYTFRCGPIITGNVRCPQLQMPLFHGHYIHNILNTHFEVCKNILYHMSDTDSLTSSAFKTDLNKVFPWNVSGNPAHHVCTSLVCACEHIESQYLCQRRDEPNITHTYWKHRLCQFSLTNVVENEA